MTTYKLDGIAGYVDGDKLVRFRSVEMRFINVEADASETFSYRIVGEEPAPNEWPSVWFDETALTEIGYVIDRTNPNQFLSLYRDNARFEEEEPEIFEESFLQDDFEDYAIGQLFWDGKSTTVFQYTIDFTVFPFESSVDREFYMFALGGEPLPEIDSLSDLEAFEKSVTGGGSVPDGDPLAPMTSIDIAQLPGVRRTEDDIYRMTYDESIDAGIGNDLIFYTSGDATVEGGEGNDRLIFDNDVKADDVLAFTLVEGGISISFDEQREPTVMTSGIETFQFGTEYSDFEIETFTFDEIRILASADPLILRGTNAAELLSGDTGDDRLVALAGDDTLEGGDGRDTLNGGAGDDRITGGATSDDLRDVVYAGAGADYADGGHGNDRIHGMDGNDTLLGGFGADVLVGQEGDDVLSGGPLSDEVSGGPGDDFLNGGFGFDRLKGGSGADKFFHVGLASHGRDWVKDYSATEGDVLVFGGDRAATGDDFLIQLANTTWAGAADVAEAFITHLPTGTRLWSLIDGAAEDYITIQVAGGSAYDLTM